MKPFVGFLLAPRPRLSNKTLEGAFATRCVQCKLWVCLGTLPVIIATIKRPSGKNHAEASGIYWQPYPLGHLGHQCRW